MARTQTREHILALLLLSATVLTACERAASPAPGTPEPSASSATGTPVASASPATGALEEAAGDTVLPATDVAEVTHQVEEAQLPVAQAPTVPDTALLFRDSAGVRIFDPAAPAWTDAERWTLDLTDFVQIGVVNGDPAHEFTAIDHGGISIEGTVALADRSREVRIFDSSGQHLNTFGRRGDGPGEFGRAMSTPEMSLTVTEDDRLIVADGRRIAWFTMEGALLREVFVRNAIRDVKLGASAMWRMAADGSLLLMGSWGGSGRYAGDNWVYLAREIDDSLTFTPITEYNIETRVSIPGTSGMPATGIARPFMPAGAAAAVAADPLRIFIADPLRREIRRHHPDGSVESIIRLPIPRTPVTSELIAAAREYLETRRNNHSRQAEMLRAFDRMSHTDSLPAIRRIYWDQGGYLWLEPYIPNFDYGTVARRLEVIREDGVWLGHIALPPDFGAIMDINSGRILTRTTDADGVHFARVYRITRQGEAPGTRR